MLLTILYVADLARARAFYDGAFGFRTTVDVPVYVEYRINAGARLGLMPQGNTHHFLGEKLGRKKPRDGCPRGEIYLCVRNAKAVIDHNEISIHSLLTNEGDITFVQCTHLALDPTWRDLNPRCR